MASVPFKVGNTYLPKMIDPSNVSSTTAFHMMLNLGGTLLETNATDEYVSCLAEFWKIDLAKKQIHFKLKPNIKFSDGTPITTKEVSESIKRLIITGAQHLSFADLIMGAKGIKNITDKVDGINVIDSHTINITFNKISRITPLLFAMPDSTILSPKQYDAQTLKVNNYEITSGPYIATIEKTPKGFSIWHLKANAYSLQQRPDSIKEIDLINTTEDMYGLSNDILAKQLKENKFDFTFDNFFIKQEQFNAIKENKNFEVIPRGLGATFGIQLNTNHDMFKNKKTRKYIYKKFLEANLDLRPIKDDTYFVKTNKYLLPNTNGAMTDKEANEYLKTFLNTQDIKLPKIKQRSIWYRFLWELSDNGASQLINWFNTIGFDIELIPTKDGKDWVKNENDNVLTVIWNYLDEQEVQQSFDYSIQAGDYYAENTDKAKELVLQLADESDLLKRKKITTELEKLLLDDAKFIPIFYSKQFDFINKNYERIEVNPYSNWIKLWNIRKKK